MEKTKRPITEQEAFRRLSALCASAEHCVDDMLKKMEKWIVVKSLDKFEKLENVEEVENIDNIENLEDLEAESDFNTKAQARIMQQLIKERYIDEERFARAFVRDKFRYNRWGAQRIRMELRRKHIDDNTIEDALTEIDDSDNLATLRELIAKKRPSVRGKSDYEIRCKLIRFALGRGFAMDDILAIVGE